MSIEERIERLENELAALKQGITTQRLVVEDEKGQVRALLGTVGDGAGMSLFDEKGELRASLLVNGLPMLTLSDNEGNERAFLGVGVGGIGPGMVFLDEKGERVWSARSGRE